MIQEDIRKLVVYGIKTGLVPEEDKIYTTNRLLELFELDELADVDEQTEQEIEKTEAEDLEGILGSMMDYAYEKGILKENSVVYRDLFDTKLMGCLTPMPREIIAEFERRYKKSPEEATDWYYQYSQELNHRFVFLTSGQQQ